MPASRTRPGAGFTLIELLVVIAVIALLIGILLPALRRARDAGRTAACLANQRSILAALNQYADDFKRIIPRESGSGHAIVPAVPQNSQPAPTASELMDITWPFNLRPYLDPRAATTDKTGGLGDDRFAAARYYQDPARPRDDHNVHYVCNGFRFKSAGELAETNKPPAPLDTVVTPSRTWYLTCFTNDTDKFRAGAWFNESSSTLFISQFYDMWCDTNLRGELAGPITDATHAQRTGPSRHAGGANTAAFDGHAVTTPAAAITSLDAWDDGDYR